MEEKQEKEKGNFWLTVASFIVNKRKAIEILFVLAMIYSVLSINKVQVNQDITSYLPADSETRIGLSLMEEQFTTYGSAKVMVSNITYAQAEDLVDDLENIEGVKQIEFDDSKDHFTGADALFSVTFDGTEDEQISKDALEEVKETLDGYDVYVSSSVGEEATVVLLSIVSMVFSTNPNCMSTSSCSDTVAGRICKLSTNTRWLVPLPIVYSSMSIL